jgi:C-terminal processing protease CtpA/Prc
MRHLSDGGMLKLTIQHFLSPGLKKIDHVGVKPDREVKLTPEDIKAKRDPQLDAAKSFLIGVLPGYAR